MGKTVASHTIFDNQQEFVDACAGLLRSREMELSFNAPLGPLPKGGIFRAPILAFDPVSHKRLGVFPRWQSASGTAEEKLAFQLIKFQMAINSRPDNASCAFFVLEGLGWTWRTYYLSSDFKNFLNLSTPIYVVSFDQFQQYIVDRAY